MVRCLIIEDMPVSRRIFQKMLEKLGFDVVEAPDIATALGHCGQAMPDVILADWNLPDGNGVQFVSQLRALPGGAYPKVLMCTIENSAEHVQRAIAAGVDEYIMKPFGIDALVERLRLVGVID